jgi:hypothetical protein
MTPTVGYTISISTDVDGVWEVWATEDGFCVEYLDHFNTYREAQAAIRELKDTSTPLGI